MGRERSFRAFARRAVALPATVTAPPAGAGPRPARLVELGLGGARVETDGALEPGGTITLEVSAPSLWDPLVVPARVAWVREAGPGSVIAGLTFEHPGTAALPALVELLAASRF